MIGSWPDTQKHCQNQNSSRRELEIPFQAAAKVWISLHHTYSFGAWLVIWYSIWRAGHCRGFIFELRKLWRHEIWAWKDLQPRRVSSSLTAFLLTKGSNGWRILTSSTLVTEWGKGVFLKQLFFFSLLVLKDWSGKSSSSSHFPFW